MLVRKLNRRKYSPIRHNARFEKRFTILEETLCFETTRRGIQRRGGNIQRSSIRTFCERCGKCGIHPPSLSFVVSETGLSNRSEKFRPSETCGCLAPPSRRRGQVVSQLFEQLKNCRRFRPRILRKQ